MKTIIGIVLIIMGIVAGLYFGVWVMFVGGIIDIVNALDAPTLVWADIGWGVVKILLAKVVGVVVFFFCSAIGGFFLALDE